MIGLNMHARLARDDRQFQRLIGDTHHIIDLLMIQIFIREQSRADGGINSLSVSIVGHCSSSKAGVFIV